MILKEVPKDSTVEYFDIFDENMKHIGVAPRSEAHREGYYHIAFQCWIVRREEAKRFVLLQKRSESKDTFPNLYDTSSAGHLNAGESIEDGVRELKEEVGLTVDFSELTSIGIIKQQKDEKSYRDYQFAYLYIYESNKPILDYEVQQEEITALVEMQIEDFGAIIYGQKLNAIASGFYLDSEGQKHCKEFTIGYNDLVAHGDEYYQMVYKGIEEYFAKGEE